MKKKIGTNGIHGRKCKLTLAVLICIFALISVSAAVSEKGTWIASLEKNGESIVFANHDESQTEGGWIQLSGGKEIQLPQPLSFSYYGPNSLERAGTTLKLNSESDKKKYTKLTYTYPYSTHPFYTENQKVTMDYNGPSAFKNQKVDIYLVKGFGVNSIEEALALANNETISLSEIFNKGTDSYTKICSCATLDKNGDLAKPITLDYLEPGSYGIIITLVDDKDKKEKCGIEKEILSATGFEVLNYELDTDSVDSFKEGENLDVDMSLCDVCLNEPAKGNFTYGAMLINKEAYKAEVNLSTNGTSAGTDVLINGIDINDLGVTNLNKSELTNGFQNLIGEGNGTISVGEKNQDTLSLTTFDLLPGDYFLFTGAYEPGKGIVGIDQKELTICTAGTSP